MPNPLPRSQRDLVHNIGRLPLRMPATTRELFELLAIHDSGTALATLLDRVDTTGVTRSHVYRLVHGRVPATPAQALAGADYDARAHLLQELQSAEFQASILPTLLASFPEKRREVFIHVPKCAGTDLILNVAPRRLSLPQVLGVEGWISREEALAAAIQIAKAMPFHDEVFVFGHLELARYVEFAGVRPSDRFFTVIRDPLDLMVSQANFSVSRLCLDPEGRDPDTAGLLALLELPRLPAEPSAGLLKDLAVRCLLNPRIAQPNRICQHLGTVREHDYRAAMTNLVTYDVEVTTSHQYSRWLHERWAIAPGTQHNRSTGFLTRREAERWFADALAERIAEDRKFYDVVDWALRQAGTASIHGTEIARLAGEALLGELPARAAAGRGAARAGAGGLGFAAQGPGPCNLYLTPVPAELIPPRRRPVVALAIEFGADGNARAHFGEGWCKPEREFTWTCASRATLHLPRPAAPGSYLLQLLAGAFVVKTSVPRQHLRLLVNGHAVGSVEVQELAVIECELPWPLLEGRETVELAFELPDAVKASSVKPVEDHRVLGLAVRRILLLGAKADAAPAEPGVAAREPVPGDAADGWAAAPA